MSDVYSIHYDSYTTSFKIVNDLGHLVALEIEISGTETGNSLYSLLTGKFVLLKVPRTIVEYLFEKVKRFDTEEIEFWNTYGFLLRTYRNRIEYK